MIFSSKLSKFGKGNNLSSSMENKNTIIIYYFLDGIFKKEITIDDNGLSLKKLEANLPYNEVIPINKYLITRIDKSVGIIKNED